MGLFDKVSQVVSSVNEVTNSIQGVINLFGGKSTGDKTSTTTGVAGSSSLADFIAGVQTKVENSLSNVGQRSVGAGLTDFFKNNAIWIFGGALAVILAVTLIRRKK